MLVHVNPSLLTLLAIPSSPPCSKPLSKLAGPPPQFTASTCCQLLHFCPPRWSCSPLPFFHFPAGCCPSVQLSPRPLQPAMPTFWPASAQWQSPTICRHKQYSQKNWWDLRVDKPGGKMQNLLVLVPLYVGLGAPLVWLYWEVIPRRNILPFLMGMKANCNLQLNSSFCF